MGARVWSLELLRSRQGDATVPTNAAIALAGYGGVPSVRASLAGQSVEVTLESIAPLYASHVNADAWWLVRPTRGAWAPSETLVLDLAPGHPPDGLAPWPPVAASIRPAGAVVTAQLRTAAGPCTQPPTCSFSATDAESIPIMTWPGNPPRMTAHVWLTGLKLAAGPLALVRLHARLAGGARQCFEGWVEATESAAASWFTDGSPPRIVGLRVVDLAGNETSFGDTSTE